MQFDTQKVWLNVRKATTEDLLDRATVYRAGMEPVALDIIEAELRDRGITQESIRAHACEIEAICIRDTDGMALPCSFCRKPAVAEGWGWQRLWKVLPVFPKRFRYCGEHVPNKVAEE
jgi:hypothetical protein